MDAEERHWTEDSELIERFVLNRLEPGERNELEDHLRICEVCKQAVRAEQLLIAGIRRSGRERFKAELAATLSAVEESNVLWPHILSAVAVVVIVMSVVFYNRWFEVIKPPEIESVIESSEGRETKESEPSLKQSQADIREKPSPVEERQHPKPPQPRKPGARIERPAKTPAARNERPAAGAHATQAPRMERSESSTLAAAGELWLEAHVAESTADMLNAPAGEEAPAQLFKPEQKEGDRRIAEPQPAFFHLKQEPLAALPASRRKALQEAPTVTARLQLRGDTTDVTLYLDPPVAASDLERARIELSADSLIVTLIDRRIVCLLPEGWREKLRPK